MRRLGQIYLGLIGQMETGDTINCTQGVQETNYRPSITKGTPGSCSRVIVEMIAEMRQA